GDLFPDRALGNLVFERAVLISDDRIALVAELVEVLVVRPHVLRELELADEARAADESSNPAFHSVLRRTFRKRRPIGPASTDHPAPVRVVGGSARVHPPCAGAEGQGRALLVPFLCGEGVCTGG